MFLEVSAAKYAGDYRLELTFNNGVTKTVDLQNELDGEVFEPLRAIDYFKNFHIIYNTVEWDNGADFAPEFLYAL
ncbi:MAG: DUF2442 domain-containing protein [Verrucomicrobiales bacterium]|jgi:hypothetical protein|nr:DUF2442 domain-containing protein [Verrucomicrobiales bacterium]